MLSWGALLGGYVQYGWTPLLRACDNGHMEVVKLLLAHPGVDINTANKVRGRGGAGREDAARAGWGTHHDDAAEGGSPHTH
jgi:ankyrin repeat protein